MRLSCCKLRNVLFIESVRYVVLLGCRGISLVKSFHNFSSDADSAFYLVYEDLQCRSILNVMKIAELVQCSYLVLPTHKLVSSQFPQPVLITSIP